MTVKMQELSRAGAASTRLISMGDAYSSKVRAGEKELLDINLQQLKTVSQEGEEVLLRGVATRTTLMEHSENSACLGAFCTSESDPVNLPWGYFRRCSCFVVHGPCAGGFEFD